MGVQFLGTSGILGYQRKRNMAFVSPPVTVNYLVVAGGGGGSGGGGGAGGYRSSITGELSGANSTAENLFSFLLSTNYNVIIGAGGAVGVTGSNSIFGPVTSLGGGAGGGGAGGADSLGKIGGAGGGGGWYPAGGGAAGGAGTALQGFAGGTGAYVVSQTVSGGGGGGAGAAGGNSSASVPGVGGAGLASSITGTSVTRAVGGAGQGDTNFIRTEPAANTGSGGFAGYYYQISRNPSAGASGVVILRYSDAYTITLGAGLTGSTTTVGSNKVTTITAGTGTVSWRLSRSFLTEYLVIAGGGNSANDHGAGGGAGGYRSSVTGELSGGNSLAETKLNSTVGRIYAVTVGAGAPKNFGGGLARGSNSSLAEIISIGGGAQNASESIRNGGSGSGAVYAGTTSSTIGLGTVGQGSNGGLGGPFGGNYASGGGGGAGGLGVSAPSNTVAGNGGPGLASSITGTSVIRAGGGGGGNYQGGTVGLGGSGGGGNAGATGGNNAGQDGAVNTGGGGGSPHYQSGSSSSGGGGSGVVILRYPSDLTITIGAGLTGSTATVGANKVTTITAGTGNVSWA
jgi:hypothetical protein